jgi:hypothetical protein
MSTHNNEEEEEEEEEDTKHPLPFLGLAKEASLIGSFF